MYTGWEIFLIFDAHFLAIRFEFILQLVPYLLEIEAFSFAYVLLFETKLGQYSKCSISYGLDW